MVVLSGSGAAAGGLARAPEPQGLKRSVDVDLWNAAGVTDPVDVDEPALGGSVAPGIDSSSTADLDAAANQRESADTEDVDAGTAGYGGGAEAAPAAEQQQAGGAETGEHQQQAAKLSSSQLLQAQTESPAPFSARASNPSGSFTPFQALLKGELERGGGSAPEATPGTPAATQTPSATPSSVPTGTPASAGPLSAIPGTRIPSYTSPAGPLAGIPSGAVSLIPGNNGSMSPGINGAAASTLVSPVSINLRAFNLFASRIRPEIRAQHPEYGGPETERAIGMKWNSMGPGEREEYLEMARKEREALVAQGLIDPNVRPRRKRRKRAEIEAEAMMKQASLGRWMRSAAAAAANAAGGQFGGPAPWGLPGGPGFAAGPLAGTNEAPLALGVVLPGIMGADDETDAAQRLGSEGLEEGKDGKEGGGPVAVGQGVHGVLDGSFDAGFFVTLRVSGSATVLRGVVFAPGSAIPVTASNDVAPGVTRAEPEGMSMHTSYDAAADGMEVPEPAPLALPAPGPVAPAQPIPGMVPDIGGAPLGYAQGAAGAHEMHPGIPDHSMLTVAAGAPAPVGVQQGLEMA